MLGCLLVALATAVPTVAQESGSAEADPAYSPGEYRVYTGAGELASLDDIVRAVEDVDVLFIGETHDDPTGHWLEAELLRQTHQAHGAGAAGRPIGLSLEFFERDVQLVLDEYLAGLISERAFRSASRPWPRYETDYRPLIEFAKEHDVPVIAANAPRRYTNRVTTNGRESLGDLGPASREHLAPLPYGQPSTAYRDQWIQVISAVMEQEGMKCGRPIPEPREGAAPVHAAAPPGTHSNMGNQLHSQVLWDATMAHSISRHLEQAPGSLVLHMVGGFHVARGTGTPEHLEQYAPGVRDLIVLIRPVADVDEFEPAPSGEWGDFVIQTDEARTLESIECRAYLAELDGR